ncbi:hypothetical protein BC938DRAFT_475831 [Jimgerdemannia flammicorona]|uniref:DUF155 domain-containing protein n=1 Tax=Jimgerdemannia flammicorona TaxID=994334 RepID=A0A433PNK6_9FUNG|nr:hypothetical protein BC938DRAFT_475831 [Jimgerdemannia flammicorona]
MRINVNLVSNILDTPEIFWSEPALEPLYSAIRGYLEISQRVELLNQRVAVISDLLDMLKEHQISLHGKLEDGNEWEAGTDVMVCQKVRRSIGTIRDDGEGVTNDGQWGLSEGDFGREFRGRRIARTAWQEGG